MSLRALLALILLLAAAVVALRWLGRAPAPVPASGPDEPLLVAFTEAQVRGVALACEGRTTLLAHGPGGAWRVEKPFAAEADPRRVHDVLGALQDARVRRVVAEHGSEDGFGLAPAACTATVTLAADGASRSLRLGRASPVGTERYAATTAGRIVLTDGSLYSALAVEPERFRERRLVPVEPGSVSRIVLDRPSGRLVLAASDAGWRIEAPVNDAASSADAEQLARAIASIELDDVGAATRPIEARADRRIAIEVTSRSASAPLRGYLAAAGIAGTRVGWRGQGEVVGTVAESAARELERPAGAFRDLRIVTFSLPDARRIEIGRGGAALRLERASESASWSGTDAQGSFAPAGPAVAALLDRLRSLTGVGVESAGIAAASGTIRVAGASGDLANLTWGPLPPSPGTKEEAVWVTTPARPGVVFRVPAVAFGPIPKDRAALAAAP